MKKIRFRLKNRIPWQAALLSLGLACAGLSGCDNPFAESSVPLSPVETGEEGEEDVPVPARKDQISMDKREGRLVRLIDVSDYVTLGQYTGLRLMQPGVSDQDVDAAIAEKLAADSSTMKKNQTVETGDTVVISYVGRIGFDTFPGSSAASYTLTVGSGEMVTGFEEALIGMKNGETRQFALTYPQDSTWQELAGVTVDFQVTLLSFTRPAALTEKYAQKQGYESVQAYREAVRQELEADEAAEEARLRQIAWQGILDRSTVTELPEADLQDARDQYDRLIGALAAQGGMEPDAYISSQRISRETYETRREEYAKERVTQCLVLQGIMDAEGMTLLDGDSQQIAKELAILHGYEDGNALAEAFGQDEVDLSVAQERVLRFAMQSVSQEAPSETESEITETAFDRMVSDIDTRL